MTRALLPPHHDAAQAKLHQRLLDKLLYCKEVLIHIRNAETGNISEAKLSTNAKAESPPLR